MNDPHAIRNPVMQWLVYGHVWLALFVAAQVWWSGLFMAVGPERWRYTLASALGPVAGSVFMCWVGSRSPQLLRSAHLPAAVAVTEP